MIFSTEPLHIVLFAMFLMMAIFQVWYWLQYYRRASYNGHDALPDATPPLSVVICARNEADNLSKFLPAVLEQDYPSYEVVVVNDCSDDNSYDILGTMMQRYPHLKVSMIQKDPGFTHSKKLAMLVGIKAAKNELLVFTDADCRPASPNWLRRVAAAATDHKDLILGYGAYIPEKGLLNRYIRYETMFTAMQYFGMAMAGVPYMGVGRNLAYRKSFFFARGGFGPHNHILSGDDDLFVNRNATADNCSLMLSHESFTLSVAQKSLSAWAKQKRRHFSTAAWYKKDDRVRLFMEPFSRVAYYGLMAALLAMLVSWPLVVLIAVLRMTMRMIILRKSARTFNEEGLWFLSLFFDILAPFVSTFLYLTSVRKGKGREAWK